MKEREREDGFRLSKKEGERIEFIWVKRRLKEGGIRLSKEERERKNIIYLSKE